MVSSNYTDGYELCFGCIGHACLMAILTVALACITSSFSQTLTPSGKIAQADDAGRHHIDEDLSCSSMTLVSLYLIILEIEADWSGRYSIAIESHIGYHFNTSWCRSHSGYHQPRNPNSVYIKVSLTPHHSPIQSTHKEQKVTYLNIQPNKAFHIQAHHAFLPCYLDSSGRCHRGPCLDCTEPSGRPQQRRCLHRGKEGRRVRLAR